MYIEAASVSVEEILPFREPYRRHVNVQVRHDSFPRRGFRGASAEATPKLVPGDVRAQRLNLLWVSTSTR